MAAFRKLSLGLVALLVLAGGFYGASRSSFGNRILQRMTSLKTTDDRLAEFGESARARMKSAFDASGVVYPPDRIVLVAIKAERELSVYAGSKGAPMKHVLSYPVLGQSGVLGPKLREGDRQVPEGLYRIEGLNPNSRFYVSMRLNYPNTFDRRMAEADGRGEPGSDIYIHGQTASIGCLAMGDEVIEELFTLAADTGLESIQVIIAPEDLREPGAGAGLPDAPPWVDQLYRDIEDALRVL